MANPWDFSTPIWYERLACLDYPTFVPCSASSPINGIGTCAYLAKGEVRKLVTTITGLDHLDGQRVVVVTDGIPTEPSQFVVFDGTIHLTDPAAVIHVGLPYTGKLQFLPLGGDGQTVNETKERKVYNVVMRLWKSLGGKFGKDEDHLFPFEYLPSDDILFTGDMHDVPFESSVDDYWSPVFVQDEPLPFMLLATVIRSEIFEDK